MTQKYDLYKNGEYVDTLTLLQICKKLCVGRTAIWDAVAKERLLDGYLIQEIDYEKSESEKVKFAEEWDNVRFKLNPNAKGR